MTAPICLPGRSIEFQRLRVAWLVVAIALISGCDGPGPGPEAEISQLVDTAVDAARTGNATALGEMVSDRYQDPQGRDRRAVVFLLRTLLGRYPNLLVVVRDLQVQPVSAALATAEMTLAVVGRDGSRSLPASIDADRVRIRLALERDGGDWRVTRAEWTRGGARF